MEIGSIVMVIVDKPDGCENINTYGEIGVITEKEMYHDGIGYTVVNRRTRSEFVYSSNQIRELTDEECRLALSNLLMN